MQPTTTQDMGSQIYLLKQALRELFGKQLLATIQEWRNFL